MRLETALAPALGSVILYAALNTSTRERHNERIHL